MTGIERASPLTLETTSLQMASDTVALTEGVLRGSTDPVERFVALGYAARARLARRARLPAGDPRIERDSRCIVHHLEEVLVNFPGHEGADEHVYALAFEYERAGAWSDASALYRNLADARRPDDAANDAAHSQGAHDRARLAVALYALCGE